MRIVLIHATPVAIDPIRDAFAAAWPEADTVNLLEDSLSADRARDDALTPAMGDRIMRLAVYGRDIGAAGILFTCSAFGPAIEAAAAALPIPVLKPNEAMFEAALGHGDRIGMVATFGPSIPSMAAEFAEAAAGQRPGARLHSALSEPAMAALRRGDADTHNRLVAEQASTLVGCDAIMLAQFSTARAAVAARARVAVPVLTSPDAAVAKLKRVLGA